MPGNNASAFSKPLSSADHWRCSIIVFTCGFLLMLKEGVETLDSDAVMITLHCKNISIEQTE